MGQYTHFHGTLQFTRDLSGPELRWLNRVLNASHSGSDEISGAILQNAKNEQTARGGGPLMFDGRETAQQSASMSGFITGEGLSAGYAGDLRISDDFDGLVYCAEKTYDMVAGVNFIIVNARTKIPDFGLKGELLADTEFAPYLWSVKINSDGMAYGEETTKDEFLAFRQKLYPNGYRGLGLIDREERGRLEDVPDDPHITPDGVDVYVGIGIKDGKPAVNLFMRDDETEIFGFVPPRMAFRLAANLVVRTIETKMPPRLVRAYRTLRGKDI